MELEGKGIFLRYWSASDAEALRASCDEIDLGKVTHIPHPYNLKHAVDFISRSEAERQTGGRIDLAIVSKGETTPVGNIGLIKIDKPNSCAELAYHLGKAHRGRGIMPEAVRIMLDYAFNELKLNRVQVSHVIGNDSSRRVIEKVGFKFEGVLRKKCNPAFGGFKDLKLYSMLKDEFKAANN